jgi:hypothetical protein
MKNIMTPLQDITAKIEQKIDTLQQDLAKFQNASHRPQWARAGADFSKLQTYIQNSISKIVATILNQEKWLNSKDKLALVKNLKPYIANQTQKVFENVTGKNTTADNQNLTNKKLNLNRKLFLVWLESLYNLYAQLSTNKQHKKWLKLLAAAQAKKAAEEETRLLNQENQEPQQKNIFIPLPRLEPKPPKNEETEI